MRSASAGASRSVRSMDSDHRMAHPFPVKHEEPPSKKGRGLSRGTTFIDPQRVHSTLITEGSERLIAVGSEVGSSV